MSMQTEARDTEIDIWQTELSGGQVLKARIIVWRGREYLDLRKWFPGPDDELLPGKGLRVNAELAGQLRAALVLVEDALEHGDLDGARDE